MFNTIGKIIKYPRLTQDYPMKPVNSSLFIGKPEIDAQKCTGCGECIRRCPSGAMVNNGDSGPVGINYDECIFCALCEDVCPAGAARMTSQIELARKSRKDLRNDALVIGEQSLPDMDEKELQNRLKTKINRMFGRSLQIREVDSGSCNGCDCEINALNNPFNDIERLGVHFVASPRHADMLLVTGTASRNMEQALLKTYNAAPDPRLVVAVGACACSGGIFRDNYAVSKGIDCLVPVGVYIPGCPPRPQAIIYGILKALDRIK